MYINFNNSFTNTQVQKDIALSIFQENYNGEWTNSELNIVHFGFSWRGTFSDKSSITSKYLIQLATAYGNTAIGYHSEIQSFINNDTAFEVLIRPGFLFLRELLGTEIIVFTPEYIDVPGINSLNIANI